MSQHEEECRSAFSAEKALFFPYSTMHAVPRSTPRALPLWAAFLLSAFSGALMACSFIPVDWSGCVWIAFLPLLTALWYGPRREGKRGALAYFLYGWTCGVVFFGISLWWINEVSTLGYIPLILFYGGLFPGIWGLVSFAMDFLVGIIVSVYMLAMKEQSLARCCKLLYGVCKEDHARWIARAVRRADGIFSGFVRGKLLDSLIIGILCLIGCTLLKMPYAPLVSLIVGVTNVIPFFGPFIGAVPATLLILIQSPIKAIWFVLFVLVLQQLDGNVIGPKILGNTTGLSSFWVLFSILLFGGLWGFVGMIVGVPLFAVIYDVIKKLVFHGLRRNGQLDQMTVYHDEFGDPGDPAPAPVEDEGTETEIVIDSGEE